MIIRKKIKTFTEGNPEKFTKKLKSTVYNDVQRYIYNLLNKYAF